MWETHTHSPHTACLLCHIRKREQKLNLSTDYNLLNNCCYSTASFNFNLTAIDCSD